MNKKSTELVDIDSFVVTKEVAVLITDTSLTDALIGGIIRALAFPDQFKPPKEAALFWNVLKVGWEQCKKQRGIKRAQAALRKRAQRSREDERDENTSHEITQCHAPSRNVTQGSRCHGNGNGNGNGNGISPIAPGGGKKGIQLPPGIDPEDLLDPATKKGPHPRTMNLGEADGVGGEAREKKSARGWTAANSAAFARLWGHHPVQQNPRGAEREFLRALKRGATPDAILAAQARMMGPGGWNDGYAPTLAKWLRNDGWNDQPRQVEKKDAAAATLTHEAIGEL